MTDLSDLVQEILREHPKVDWLVRSPSEDDPENSGDFFANVSARTGVLRLTRRFPRYGATPEEALAASLDAYREHVGYVTRALQ